ncbi:MAG TPA: ABC transporter permease [Dongiaceae bacterium]|jgi:ribose transport system permease protein|nr:ABC transporter permease [Dongiaceae bacterium]
MQLAKTLVGKYGLVVVLLLLIVFFSAMKPEFFPTRANAGSIMSDNAILTLVALGVMVPLIVGQFDVSVGFVATLGVMLTAGLLSRDDLPWPLVVLIVTGCGAAIGLLMGILVGYVGLNSLIVSLGVGSTIQGIVLLYSNGEVIFQGISKSFQLLGQTRLFGFIPLPFLYALIAGIVLWFILTLRPIGRRLYAIGGSPEAARIIGINVKRYVAGSFVVSSTVAAFAGCLQVARVGAGHPTAAQALLLPAFAAAFLGATAFRPGFYNVWGTFIAVYLVGAGTTGLFMLGADAYVQPIFNGTILVLAVTGARLGVLRKARIMNAKAGAGDQELGGPQSDGKAELKVAGGMSN